MTWTNHTYSSGEVLTSSKMTTLQDNFTAMANGDSGAPSLVSGAYPSAVTQAKLSTTTASGSTTGTTYALTGGTYSWWTISATSRSFGGSDTAAGVIGISSSGISPAYIDERYIQASPPYNLGNGDIPLFVFACLAKSGEILGVQVMPDPPWAYHGPTDIRADRYDKVSGRAWKLVEKNEVELTHSIKNRDMFLYPHPFSGIPGNHKIILLDPLSKLTHRLFNLLGESHASEVRKLLLSRNIKFHNDELDCNTPPGVIAVSGVIK